MILNLNKLNTSIIKVYKIAALYEYIMLLNIYIPSLAFGNSNMREFEVTVEKSVSLIKFI